MMRCLLIILALSVTNALLDTDIIQEFYKKNSIHYSSILTCNETKHEKVKIFRQLSKNGQQINFFHISPSLSLKNVMEFFRNDKMHLGIILDGDCLEMEQFLKKCGILNYFREIYHWLILTTSYNTLENFNKTNLNINTDVKVAILEQNEDKWSIYDIYNTAYEHGGKLNFTFIGYYSKDLGWRTIDLPSKHWTRKNMTGVTFRTMIVTPLEFNESLKEYVKDDQHRNQNTLNRFHCRLIHYCRNYYNFSLNVSQDKSWGYTNSDGTFDGMVGKLEQKLIDFGCSPLFLRSDREKVIDYGRLTWILGAKYLFRNPSSRSPFDIFVKPLSKHVWYVFLAILIVAAFTLKLIMCYERRKCNKNIESSWSITILFIIGALCQQGSQTISRLYCGRIITFFILILSLVIYQFYSASIVSSLLLKPSTFIRNLKDLVQSTLKVGCEDTLYTRDYFIHTTDTWSRKLYTEKILTKKNTSNFLPPEEGLQLVQKGNYAYHVELATAYPIIEKTFDDKSKCDLREVLLLKTQLMYANLQKDSPFRDMLNICLHSMAEKGILYRERKHWHPRKPECIHSAHVTLMSVDLDQFYPALLILLIGMLCSLIILIFEHLLRIYRNLDENKVILPFVE